MMCFLVFVCMAECMQLHHMNKLYIGLAEMKGPKHV